MRANEAAIVLVADSLESGLPLDDGLTSLHGIGRAVRPAKAGDVRATLTTLGVPRDVADVAAQWPRVLAPALRRLAELPSGAAARLHIAQTAAYVFFVALVQLAVVLVLSFKVLPSFHSMDQAAAAPSDAYSSYAMLVLAVVLLPLMLWFALSTTGWRRLFGWGRELFRAKQAAIGAALLESNAPADVRLAFFSKQKWLGDETLDAVDLDALRLNAIENVDRKLQRFVATARVVSLGLLALSAVWTLLSVYGAIALLPLGVK